MEVSSIQIYIAQFFRILSDPVGIMALLAMCGLAMLVVITRTAKWFALALALFAIACSLPASKYMSQAPFIAPLQFMRVWSRPIAFVALLMLLACAIRFDRGPRRQLMSASFWMFVTFQVFASLRLILVPSLAERGVGAIAIIALLIGVAVLTLAPGIQSLQDASKAVWALAGCCLCFIGATLLQFAANPNSIEHLNRLFGVAGNPQYAAYLMALTLPSLCFLFIRRKQGIWITQSLVLFGLAIPTTVLLLIWTGSRGGVMTAMVGLIVFFHRRLGRFVIAGSICLIVGLFLSQYLGDAFGILNRFFGEQNTRAAAWAQMFNAISQNPLFGYIQNTGNVYNSTGVGEGGFLMSLSLYGVVGTAPLFLALAMIGREMLELYRIRKITPELNDLTDLVLAFWCAFIFANMFESFIVSYFTNTIFITYTFFVLQGFVLDYGRQALSERSLGFPVIQHEQEQYGHYAVS